MLNNIYGIRPAELSAFLGESFPAYRARQLLKWIYGKHVFDPAGMTDLPANFREFISTAFDFRMPEITARLKSADGSEKFRLSLADGQRIEMVLMPQAKKLTLCVSSQAGCARGCSFCATGAMKLKRNLLTHEIVQQILLATQAAEQPITNIVFMGMGEPMDNLDNVMDALKLIQDESTLAFSPRRTTLSTCGIVPGIHLLADSGVKVKLAVSLNSARNEVRDELMPVNRKYPLDVLKKALLYYQHRSRFRITLEYILIPELNMSGADVKALRKFCGDLSCKVNFIPYNQVSSLPYRAPTEEEIERFLEKARDLPQAITLRRSRGADICGACGQLAAGSIHK
jgi:23S rRNA (adenine2503-C2)-methyltransferase